MQPRVGIDLKEGRKTIFSEIFAGRGGVDSYTNAISDIYQDNFNEGSYTGKGIYDLEVFYNVMKDKIPENTVLSHDLLEGCYLRCGLVSDIMLLDGYPKSYMSYLTRLERWIRGDYQILSWIKSKDLNRLSKFKIIDNIRRSLLEFSVALGIIVVLVSKINGTFLLKNSALFMSVLLLSVIIPSVIEFLNFVIFRKENIKKQKSFYKSIDGLTASFYRGVINVMTIPIKAYVSISAAIKTLYRMTVSKKNLLEWTTSAEAEEKNSISSFSINTMSKMGLPNFVFAFIVLILMRFANLDLGFSIITFILAFLFLVSPFIMWSISKEKEKVPKYERLNCDEKNYVQDIAKKTWDYFADYMNKENSYLPPDNFQSSRRQMVVNRTSSTNIGLGLLTIVASYDLKFIDFEDAILKLENSLNVIDKMEKWNGHLYNWYNTSTLEPLIPRYVSTVDSRKFHTVIYIL